MEINQVLPTAEKNTGIQLAVARLRLHFERPMRSGEAPALRGFFGNKFEEEVVLHNHGPNNELIYQKFMVKMVTIKFSSIFADLPPLLGTHFI